jgi:phosphoglycolate phosphatase-like HAD superfamily hydrolase
MTTLVWLFDVDGTLLVTDGAAREAFSRALAERFGVEDDLTGIPFAGRTDPLILGDILRRHALELPDAERGRFWDMACGRMGELLMPGRGRVLPGVREVLDRIDAEPAWARGLLTGNTRRMAAIKLRHFSLDRDFAFGAFGDEASDRNALACVAVERVAARFGVDPSRCVVVGDTEHDVACARAAGARAVAVATGSQSRAELEAHRPDLLLDRLDQDGALIEWARVIAGGDGVTAR